MAIDFNKLRGLQKDLENKTSGNVMYASKINGQTDIRILPPHPDMDGSPYFERINWNVGKEIVTSPSTFNEFDPIEEEVTMAKAYVEQLNKSKVAADRQYAKELATLLNDWQHCKKKTDYLISVLPIIDDGVDVNVSEPKIFSCGITVVQALVAVISDRKYMNGTEDGVADRVKGRNFTIAKSGEKKDTKYTVTPWPDAMEIDQSFYTKIPNPVEFVRKGMYSEEYLRSLIRNYLYGEELMEKPARGAEEEPEVEVIEKRTPPAPSRAAAPARPTAPAPAPARAAAPARKAPVTQPKPEPDPEQVEEGGDIQPDESFDQGTPTRVPTRPAQPARPAAPAAPQAPRRNILNDLKK
jgi:hypothetical protein